MRVYINKIVVEKIKIKKFEDEEIKKKIINFIWKSSHVPKVKKYFLSPSYFKKTRGSISKQKLVCLLSGRKRGIWKFSGLSRHTINKLNLEAKINPLSVRSW